MMPDDLFVVLVHFDDPDVPRIALGAYPTIDAAEGDIGAAIQQGYVKIKKGEDDNSLDAVEAKIHPIARVDHFDIIRERRI